MKRFTIMKGEHNFGTDYNEYTANELREREWRDTEMYPCTLLETFDEEEAKKAFSELKSTAYFTSGYAFKHTVYVTYYCLCIEKGELDEDGDFYADDAKEITADFDAETYTA